ncbi:hypothetical protein FHS89_001274 [Rubricella aquisinus]|uniref:Uncharacterized protein n=1 Tax=Rubricella aquisinus TaxID=2028108 RepID=A0A840WY11_9RHOB|nr:hypothetical protein [Rubricella aquisinus]MBB5515264.1 hypothetical protein [Rubricella aquisinus]
MTPQTLNYLIFGIGIGLLIQPVWQMAKGEMAAAAPFAAIGIGLWVFALIRIRVRSGKD